MKKCGEDFKAKREERQGYLVVNADDIRDYRQTWCFEHSVCLVANSNVLE